MSIALPKDAEGREIPLDTEILYDEDGTKVSVKEILSRTLVESQETEWVIKAQYEGNLYYNSFEPKNMHLTQPDSWEKLEEDLDRCVAEKHICMYYSKDGTCRNCAIRYTSGGCSPKVLKDIVSRIRKLRGED